MDRLVSKILGYLLTTAYMFPAVAEMFLIGTASGPTCGASSHLACGYRVLPVGYRLYCAVNRFQPSSAEAPPCFRCVVHHCSNNITLICFLQWFITYRQHTESWRYVAAVSSSTVGKCPFLYRKSIKYDVSFVPCIGYNGPKLKSPSASHLPQCWIILHTSNVIFNLFRFSHRVRK
jgi:hypothetical protein